jgi:hypothetical protein
MSARRSLIAVLLPFLVLVTLCSASSPQLPKPLETEKVLFDREIYRYDPGVQRDPFQPLTQKRLLARGQATANISDLRLIGVVWGPAGNLALVEDSGGMGYILRSGDRVAGGRVLSVLRDSVVFELNAYGTTVKATLKLGRQGE